MATIGRLGSIGRSSSGECVYVVMADSVRPMISQKVGNTLLGVAMSPVAIVATMRVRVMGGLKISASTRGSRQGDRPHQRRLANIRKWPKR